MSEEKKEKFITNSPKANFFIGLLAGVAIISLVGFGYLGNNQNKNNNSNGEQNNSEQVAGEQGEGEKNIELAITEGDYVLGNPDAPVKVFEFSDFQCPYCQRFHVTMHRLVEEYDGQVAWIFKHFPISSHPLAYPGALATECAGEQGKFWEMSDKIYEDKNLNQESFAQFAEEMNLNMDQYNSCIEEERHKEKIASDYNLGVESGVRGTPTNFVNNQAVPGAVPYENMVEIVENILNK